MIAMPDPPEFARDLTDTIARTVPALRGVPDEVSSHRPAPGKWSAREVLGHLIDSAVNNQLRFVLGNWQEDLVFPGYDQEAWVRVQDYQHAPWDGLVAIWAAYNLHLVRVMAATPPEVRRREHRVHNLDVIGMHSVPRDKPGTLEYLMSDYVVHVHHHLEQIGALVGVPDLGRGGA